MTAKLSAYVQLMRLDKPIGILLLLWPTYWALLLSSKDGLDASVWIVFTLGVIIMRSAGCVINDFADRDFDGYVKRTQHRPLPSSKVTPKEAIVLFVLLCFSAFCLVLTMNATTIQFSVVGVLLAFIYPFMKRYTSLPQLFLGLAFSWSIPMAWVANGTELNLLTWLLFLTNILWTVAYDTQYAMVDRDDDLSIGIRSTAILFGRFDKLWIAVLQLLSLSLLFWIGHLQSLGSAYYWMLLLACGLMVYQQYLIRHREREACFKAFLNNNYVGMVICFGLASNLIL